MSTPKPASKKPSTKTVEPKAKFSIGQKVFIIDRGRSNPGYIFQAKVESVRTIKGTRSGEGICNSNGKIEPRTSFEYDLSTMSGWFSEVNEWSVHHNLTAASLAFTEQFTHLLK